LPSVTLGKAFAECKIAFAVCLEHTAKELIPVVNVKHVNILKGVGGTSKLCGIRHKRVVVRGKLGLKIHKHGAYHPNALKNVMCVEASM
jgi:hypothetical protein